MAALQFAGLTAKLHTEGPSHAPAFTVFVRVARERIAVQLGMLGTILQHHHWKHDRLPDVQTPASHHVVHAHHRGGGSSIALILSLGFSEPPKGRQP